jgi:hypothetical protein
MLSLGHLSSKIDVPLVPITRSSLFCSDAREGKWQIFVFLAMWRTRDDEDENWLIVI